MVKTLPLVQGIPFEYALAMIANIKLGCKGWPEKTH